MSITIKTLMPDLIGDYFDFFDNRAFEEGSPYYPCYCNAFNLRRDQIKQLFTQAEINGGGMAGWKKALRDSAWRMVSEGVIQGYLAYDNDLAIGWCNANDRLNYYRVGEFNLDDNIQDEDVPADCKEYGLIKSIVCFEISSLYRGTGIARKLLEQVCQNATLEGYSFVEAYPKDEAQDSSLSFTGPYRLYKKAGFNEFDRNGPTIIMRKALK